jgi:hypothetical protein
MMKKGVLLVVALLLLAAPLNAQMSKYIGLYIDELHDMWCATGVGFYPVEMWIWCLPNDLGQICAEFAVAYPPNVIQSTVTQNTAIISVTLGDLPSGMSVCYIACQWDWHWNFHQTCYVTDPTPTHIEIIPHPDAGVYQFATCEAGYPTRPCVKLTNLYVNYPLDSPECLGTATEEKSWGAIKSLYR